MRFDPTPFSLEVDSCVVAEDAVFALVANVRTYIGRWSMLSDADPSDGLLDVLVFRGTKRWDLSGLAFSFFLQKHLARDDVVRYQGREIRAFAAEGSRVPVHVDGDDAGWLPARAVVRPASVRVVVPKREFSASRS